MLYACAQLHAKLDILEPDIYLTVYQTSGAWDE